MKKFSDGLLQARARLLNADPELRKRAGYTQVLVDMLPCRSTAASGFGAPFRSTALGLGATDLPGGGKGIRLNRTLVGAVGIEHDPKTLKSCGLMALQPPTKSNC